MTVATPASAAQITERRFNPDRLFYVVAAGVTLIFTAEGFRNFYLHGRALWGDDHPDYPADRCSRARHVRLGNSIFGSKHSDTDWPPATSSGDWSA